MRAKKKTREKKLKILRETLRQLDDRSLVRILGGISEWKCSGTKPCVTV